jgi:hypothetical protein
MKKVISFLLFIVFSHAILAQTQDAIATLTMSIGDVYIKKVMQKKWKSGHIGASIYSGDRVKTKESGKVEVTFNDGSVVFLGNDSEIEFLDQDEKKAKKSLFLFFGSLQNNVNKGTEYEVETVHALATVKGTEFIVKSNENEMEVAVISGIVFVQNEYGKQKVSKGKKSNVTSQTKPSLKKMTKKEIKTFSQHKINTNYFIDLKIPSEISKKKWLLFSGSIKNEFGEKVQEKIDLKIESSKGVVLSKDGKELAETINLNTNNGRFEFYMQSSIENGRVSVVSNVAETVSFYMDFKSEETTKRVFIQFKDHNGNMKKAEALFEKVIK